MAINDVTAQLAFCFSIVTLRTDVSNCVVRRVSCIHLEVFVKDLSCCRWKVEQNLNSNFDDIRLLIFIIAKSMELGQSGPNGVRVM